MTDKLRKMHAKNAYLGSIFIPEKYVIRVLFVSMDEPDTPSCHSSGPPGGDRVTQSPIGYDRPVVSKEQMGNCINLS